MCVIISQSAPRGVVMMNETPGRVTARDGASQREREGVDIVRERDSWREMEIDSGTERVSERETE